MQRFAAIFGISSMSRAMLKRLDGVQFAGRLPPPHPILEELAGSGWRMEAVADESRGTFTPPNHSRSYQVSLASYRVRTIFSIVRCANACLFLTCPPIQTSSKHVIGQIIP